MEAIESIAWVMSGFVPTLIGLEAAWRLSSSKRAKVSAIVSSASAKQA